MLNRSYLQHFIEDSIHQKNKSCFISIMLTRQNLQENNFLLAVTSQNCLRRPLKIIAKSFNQFLRINQFFFSFDILSQYNENKKIQIITLRYFVTQIFPHNTTFCSYCSGQELMIMFYNNHNPSIMLALVKLYIRNIWNGC